CAAACRRPAHRCGRRSGRAAPGISGFGQRPGKGVPLSMRNVAEQMTSLDEFVAWERDQPERYEYAGGVITMMTGGSAAHVTIAMNLAFALRHALRGTGCRPFGSDMKGIANHTVRYPDISVICRPVG